MDTKGKLSRRQSAIRTRPEASSGEFDKFLDFFKTGFQNTLDDGQLKELNNILCETFKNTPTTLLNHLIKSFRNPAFSAKNALILMSSCEDVKNNILVATNPIEISLILGSVFSIFTNDSIKYEITKSQRVVENSRSIAYTHLITGLPNNKSYQNSIENEIKRINVEKKLRAAKKSSSNDISSNVAVFYLDVNSFKKINDTYSHGDGDEVLNIVAQDIHKTIRKGDRLFHIGGDEFVIIVTDTDLDSLNNLQNRLRENLCSKIYKEVPYGCCVGYAVYNTNSEPVSLKNPLSNIETNLIKLAEVNSMQDKEQFYKANPTIIKRGSETGLNPS